VKTDAVSFNTRSLAWPRFDFLTVSLACLLALDCYAKKVGTEAGNNKYEPARAGASICVECSRKVDHVCTSSPHQSQG
jgi:hypothetical protein